MNQCKCGSHAINPHCHGRESGVDLNLCDVCYWRTRAEAAKAASVCPVNLSWCYESNECDIVITGMSDEDSTKFGNWLRERMKERGEG